MHGPAAGAAIRAAAGAAAGGGASAATVCTYYVLPCDESFLPNLKHVFHEACSHHSALGFHLLRLDSIWILFGSRLIIVNCTRRTPIALR